MPGHVKNARSAMFLARLAELRRIGTFVEGYCADAGLARERCLRLNLVLEELFINTVNHGHRGDCDAPIWIQLDAQPQAVQLTYEDTAPPFNPFVHRVEIGKIGGLEFFVFAEIGRRLDVAEHEIRIDRRQQFAQARSDPARGAGHQYTWHFFPLGGGLR